MALIDELYDADDSSRIKLLYSSDPSSRDLIMRAIGDKIIASPEKILTSKPVDILGLICSTASFASSKEECFAVAIIVNKGLSYPNPLPYLMDDHGFSLAEKTLTALSFFRKAMERRTKYHSAPSPDFYRKASKLLFQKNDHEDIAEHHEQWEAFLSEMFV
jgi:hypothetical protein